MPLHIVVIVINCRVGLAFAPIPNIFLQFFVKWLMCTNYMFLVSRNWPCWSC